MTAPPSISVTGQVTDAERDQVRAIERAATVADGVSPLDDQVRHDLSYTPPASTRHLLARLPDSDTVVGYAHVDVSSDVVASAHLVVDPAHRHQGVGTALIEALTAESQPRPLRVWAHGDEAAARFLSDRLGFRRVRDLWRMALPLTTRLPVPTYPDDVTVRAFVPGPDDEGWVALNARAFRDHPEQGQLTVADLRQRTEQPWFDPAGFFLAERRGELVGFHWTKVHPADALHPAPVGEVYAVGVSPEAQGLGLGKALTLTGLQHLQGLGLAEVMLYVDADNAAAVRVYEGLGFDRAAVDVMYERP